ncbi:MAG: hypothetical protein J0M10_16490 [Chitinophagales bacterium]|nr:hypothetical protein [Chitinophagales bacterium]
MNPHNNKIVEILVNNVGIDKEELFIKSGYTSKREFISEINLLQSSYRIATIYDRHIYAPRVLLLVELTQQKDQVTRRIPLNYLPTDVLIEKLNFKERGTEPEDRIDYFLEIAGYELKPKDKAFMEIHSNTILDFNKYCYSLWAKYLQPKMILE